MTRFTLGVLIAALPAAARAQIPVSFTQALSQIRPQVLALKAEQAAAFEKQAALFLEKVQ